MNLVNLIDNNLLTSSSSNSLYDNSPFKEIRMMAPKSKGTRYEDITISLLNKMGYEAKKVKEYEYDAEVDGEKVELKGSTLNADQLFNFMQIRMNDDFDYIILTCFWPLDLRMFKIAKEDVLKSNLLASDQGGKRNTTNMVRLVGNPENCQYCHEITAKTKPVKGMLV